MSNADGKRTLLIVDDDIDLLEILTEELSSPDRIVLSAASGAEAFEKYINPEYARTHQINAVVSDMNMPHFSGLEVLLGYMTQEFYGNFVFLTGYSDKLKMLLGMRYGAYEFVEKPYYCDDLNRIVKRSLDFGFFARKCHVEIPQHLKSLGFEPSQIHRLVRKTERVALLEGTLSGRPEFDISGMIRGSTAQQIENYLLVALRKRFQHCSLELTSALLERSGELSSSVKLLEILRDVFHATHAIKKASYAFGFEEIGIALGMLEVFALNLRAFPQYFDQERSAQLVSLLGSAQAIFKNVESESIGSSALSFEMIQTLKPLLGKVRWE